MKKRFNAKLQDPEPKKEDILISLVWTRYSNLDLKIIFSIAGSFLNSVKDNKLKKVYDKCKVMHASENSKFLLSWLSKRETSKYYF